VQDVAALEREEQVLADGFDREEPAAVQALCDPTHLRSRVRRLDLERLADEDLQPARGEMERVTLGHAGSVRWPAPGANVRDRVALARLRGTPYDPAVATTFEYTPSKRIANKLLAPIARLGLGGKRMHLLTVVGRKTGRRYSMPVMLVFYDGQRWLVAPYGERPWVKNARAAGSVELTRGRRREQVRIEEVDPQTAAPILREYLQKTGVTASYFDASKTSPLDAFAAEAPRHPVFRLVP
jgi:deazaflavin-dependent oxidoreductase (nitroreductase family)